MPLLILAAVAALAVGGTAAYVINKEFNQDDEDSTEESEDGESDDNGWRKLFGK